MIHPSSDVQSKSIGVGTKIWQFCVVLPGATIGADCNINAHVFIENDVVIGDRVTIKPGVQIWDGIRIEDDVFIGPNATFTNDLRPRSKQYLDGYPITRLCKKCTIGANATILPGLEFGSYSMVGAGSVVTRSIPDRALVVGNPAKIVGWLNTDGSKMDADGEHYLDNEGHQWVLVDEKLMPNLA